jgi:hypothetical protein
MLSEGVKSMLENAIHVDLEQTTLIELEEIL